MRRGEKRRGRRRSGGEMRGKMSPGRSHGAGGTGSCVWKSDAPPPPGFSSQEPPPHPSVFVCVWGCEPAAPFARNGQKAPRPLSEEAGGGGMCLRGTGAVTWAGGARVVLSGGSFSLPTPTF